MVGEARTESVLRVGCVADGLLSFPQSTAAESQARRLRCVVDGVTAIPTGHPGRLSGLFDRARPDEDQSARGWSREDVDAYLPKT